MPTIVRSRVALLVLVGIFLIPVGFSSLNGLTHVLTCQQKSPQPFTIRIPSSGHPTILSSTTLDRGPKQGLCGGLSLDMEVGATTPGKLKVILPITNHTKYRWRGSVKFVLGRVSVPVDMGTIRAGATATKSLTVRVDPGNHEVNGSLLIGP